MDVRRLMPSIGHRGKERAMSVQMISVERAARRTFSTMLTITVAVALALLLTMAAARAGHGVLRTPSAPAPTVCQVAGAAVPCS